MSTPGFQLDPVLWRENYKKRMNQEETKSSFDTFANPTPSFSSAKSKNKEGSIGAEAPQGFELSKGAKKEIYGRGFDNMADSVSMLSTMEQGDTIYRLAEENKKYQDALQAKQRAACRSNKKKGLVGSLITAGVGAATGNWLGAAQGAMGAVNSLGGC